VIEVGLDYNCIKCATVIEVGLDYNCIKCVQRHYQQ
jgi:hypothetical protein